MAKIVTLLTDFGLQDEFVGVMKGVIWSIAPQAQLVDITHAIQPQNILHGALVLGRAYRYFPPGSIHLSVVDPGVGTHRRGIALQVGEHTFVGPDNGLFTVPLISGEPVQAVSLDNPAYRLSTLSRSFHGRDLFAPAAAHLANGIPLHEFGSPADDLVKIEIPRPMRIGNIWQAQVMLVDSFGNLITNLRSADLAGQTVVEITCEGEKIHGMSETFGGSQPGSLIAMLDSSDSLSLCLVNGSAAQHLAAGPGTLVEVLVTELPAG